MKRLILTDRLLAMAFVLSAATGIALHIAGHGDNHEAWHAWAVGHVATSLGFLIAGGFHVYMHLGWYKGLLHRSPGRRSPVTAALTVVFLCVVSTGMILLGTEGANSPVGLWHYRIGLLLAAISIGHMVKRRRPLFKRIKR